MRRPVRIGSAVLATALLCLTGPLSAVAAPSQLSLPEPTGPHAVATNTLHLRDESRADPWVPSEKRELMVTLWYPSTAPAGNSAQYMTPEESRLFLERQENAGAPPIEPKELLSTVRTHAKVDAPALTAPNGHPLVVLSPGFSWPRATLTGMAEDLASRGYVVAAIGHNYEAAGTSFPDGRVTECPACETNDPVKVVDGRAKDVSFTLDSIARHPQYGPLTDERRIAMVGHSIGGASATEAMLTDPRVLAGVNLDGTFQRLPEPGLDRPFLMLGQGAHAPQGFDVSWDETWERLHGWKRWTTLNGAGHGSSTDASLLANQLGIQYPGEPLPGARGAELSNRYVAAFLDLHLRGEPQSLLDGPTKDNPEVLFWHLPRP